ncbi:MAG: zf-HC2 domain-containing protein, partial [Thermoanaerobaculia bacterium]
ARGNSGSHREVPEPMSTHETGTCSQFKEAVTEFLEGALSGEQKETFRSHRERCGSCREFLEEMVDCLEGLGRLRVDDLTAERETELVALFRSLRQTRQDGTSSGEASTEELLRELLAHSPEQGVILVRNCARFRSVELCQLAIDRGYDMGAQDPAQALELTTLAAVIADSLDEQQYSAGVVSELRARAYAFLGNARRIGSDLAGADEAFERATRLVASESFDLSVKATVLLLQGSLLGEQLRYDEAFKALGMAEAIFREEGRVKEAVTSSIVLALHLSDSGRPESAIQRLEEIRAQADEVDAPRLSLALRHNLAFSLLACGRSEEARRLIPEVRRLHELTGNAVDLTRFKWLEGQIAVDTGRLRDAEVLFLEVKQFFVDQGMAHDVGLVSLDLALVYLRQGRVAELKALAAEMVKIFGALRVHQEALAALAFCRKAMEVEQMTAGLVRELGRRLEEARERASVGVGLSVAE